MEKATSFITRKIEKKYRALTFHSDPVVQKLYCEEKVYEWIKSQRVSEIVVLTPNITAKAISLDSIFKDARAENLSH